MDCLLNHALAVTLVVSLFAGAWLAARHAPAPPVDETEADYRERTTW